MITTEWVLAAPSTGVRWVGRLRTPSQDAHPRATALIVLGPPDAAEHHGEYLAMAGYPTMVIVPIDAETRQAHIWWARDTLLGKPAIDDVGILELTPGQGPVPPDATSWWP